MNTSSRVRLLLSLVGLVWLGEVTGAAVPAVAAAEQAEGWRWLFNGRDLSGWRLYGKPTPPEQGWVVEGGVLKKQAKVRGGDLITVDRFLDFELRWEWRMAPGGNNGIKYCVTEARPGAPGHEYQMIDDEGHPDGRLGPKRQTAAFYDVLPPLPAKAGVLKPAGEWNTSAIVVRGPRVEHWLNGVRVLEYEFGSAALREGLAGSKFKQQPGFGEKIEGHIMLTDHADECWFRSIKIRVLGR